MTNKTAKELLEKYKSGTITDDELSILESWYNIQAKNNADFSISEQQVTDDLRAVSDNLQSLKSDSSNKSILRSRSWLSVAAAIIVLCTFGILYTFISTQEERTDLTLTSPSFALKKSNIIIPGDKRALLTLEDNTQINLDDMQVGSIETIHGVRISKTADGGVLYDVSGVQDDPNAVNNYNTISTPAGGEFQVKLSDGTKVWLNASSSIKFPTKFASNERRVETTGEVYFDVTHQANKPFFVSSGTQTIKVLGTQFNINSYSTKKGVKTTLVEGSVVVQSNLKDLRKVLKPGQESILDESHSKISISRVDLERAVAWKNGYFIFDDENLEEIMDQIARWYDAEVEYVLSDKNIRFGGAISRYRKLPDVLNLLEMTDKVKFKIQGRRIIVMD